MAERVVRSEAEPEPQPDSPEELEHDDVPPEQAVGPRREAPARVTLVRKVLRRRRSPPVVPPTVHTSPAAAADDSPRDLRVATRGATKSADSTAGERTIGETEPAPPHPSPPAHDERGRAPQRPGVVEFEAPAQRRASRVERPARPDLPVKADVARPPATVPRAKPAVDDLRADRMWERVAPAPAPTREPKVERPPEPASPLQTSRLKSSVETGAPPGGRAEPLSTADIHPWPELPSPVDHPDSEVEAALRAWEHQRRIDREQTRL